MKMWKNLEQNTLHNWWSFLVPPKPLTYDWLLQLLTFLGSFDPPVWSRYKDHSGIWRNSGWTAVMKVTRSHPHTVSNLIITCSATDCEHMSSRVSDLRKPHLVADNSKRHHWHLGSERSCVGVTANHDMNLFIFQAFRTKLGKIISYTLPTVVATFIFGSTDDRC